MTICRKCGSSNKDNQKFCAFCHELLIADPVELAKRETAQQKKQAKEEKRLRAQRKRWKNAPFLLIPIGILDLLNLLLCVDLLLMDFGKTIGELLGEILKAGIGDTMKLLGNLVYTVEAMSIAVRGLEVLLAIACLVIATVLSIIMIVRMIKWHIYKKTHKDEVIIKQSAQATQTLTEDAPAQGAAFVGSSFEGKAVSYEELEKISRNHAEYSAPAAAKEVSFAQLFTDLKLHLWEYDDDSIRRILSAMSGSRMLLCSAGALDSASIFDNLSRAFGCRAEQVVYEQNDLEQSFESILLQKTGEAEIAKHSAFACALYAAKFAPQNARFAGVRDLQASRVQDAFSPLIPYFKLPEGAMSLYMGNAAQTDATYPKGIDAGKMVLPGNLWMIDVLPEQDRTLALDPQIGQYCAAIYLHNSRNAFPPEGAEAAKPVQLSVSALQAALSSAEQEFYLSEELWKVLDTIEEQMLERGGERFSNRTLRMLERYTAAYIACGGKQTDAFDNGFAAIIVPGYAEQLRMIAKKEEGETLSALLERMVGRDRIPVTVEVLTSMELI